MTELVVHQPQNSMTEVMDYARAVQSASMLPDAYRGKPADIMLAVGLGNSMGLSPAESLYRINVIKGKPTAAAELIASNVRKAGHRLRVQTEGTTVTATIVRADDPDFEHTVVRDAAWAKQMGLADQANYKKQAVTMLQWRAITAVARLACSEALYGVQYTPDEILDSAPLRSASAPTSASERMASILGNAPEPEETEPITPDQLKKLHTVLTKLSMTREDALPFYSGTVGRDIDSSKSLTKDEASHVIDALKRLEAGDDEPVDGEVVE